MGNPVRGWGGSGGVRARGCGRRGPLQGGGGWDGVAFKINPPLK